jgi:hypothetical protein
VHDALSAWCETARWSGWVEGLERVLTVNDGWPEPGGSVRWESSPAGRGTVTERVLRYEPLSLIESEIEDDQVIAHQLVGFTPIATGTVPGADAVELALEFSYRIKGRSPFTPVVDFLFVRRAMGASLQTTLDRFAGELAAATQ